jgi:hypothetical protein
MLARQAAFNRSSFALKNLDSQVIETQVLWFSPPSSRGALKQNPGQSGSLVGVYLLDIAFLFHTPIALLSFSSSLHSMTAGHACAA